MVLQHKPYGFKP